MQLEFHQVDAFATQPFTGNPAMVYRLDSWLDDALMQQIAAEHNLAETAFVVKEGAAWHIRWFTPTAEVPLCGHATLASAHVLFEVYDEPGEVLDFTCLSGALQVSRAGGKLVLNFPVRRVQPCELRADVEQALGQPVESVLALYEGQGIQELLAILPNEAAVRAFQPDLAAVARLPGLGLLISAPGDEHDFVSRYFAPFIGIDEDPVTGSTHCMLTPYWAQRLDKSRLSALQCSARGGELHCELAGERVKIAGQALLIASGRLFLS
ncbi:MAG: PhzF family phenazine biosynthesis protein [Pseudomonas sp.]|uniref:PhzF family phenazine biosynthesis protein n=1 Tax=Pseudomonas sp. TaxID=306 RepID=UPI002725BAFA|nr:PhzF family phenazine biosynthesis protein [Pseudomonas sp.]MDO9619578.1 PhzF family phenazine biosynthesis protein [Pseudomonas sp.]MDP2446131.1 PhzF family phenazine biosynthesis protein [Pseudomonas sp.]MDZ4335312.1 PhzF family phenazine biosynthesis protein [Pseudomonas sp.]